MTDSSEDQLDGRSVSLIDAALAPGWLRPLLGRALDGSLPGLLDRAARQRQAGNRQSAVLLLLAEGPQGPDLLLTRRATTLRTHAGEPAFPGGAIDHGEDAVTAALREGQEETGVEPGSVTPLVLLPRLYLPASEFVVQPVLAFWHTPGPVGPVNVAETSAVARVPIADLIEPANRVWVQYRTYRGVGFRVADMLVWGFTAALVDAVLELGGWSLPWNAEQAPVIDISPDAAQDVDSGR